MIVVMVLVVLLVGFMMYQNAQSQKSANETMLWAMQNQGQQPEANVWSSMGDWANIIGGVGAIVGSGQNGEEVVVDDDGNTRIINSVNSPSFENSLPATAGFENLRTMVEYGEGIQLNG